jgi:hypothetical protein
MSANLQTLSARQEKGRSSAWSTCGGAKVHLEDGRIGDRKSEHTFLDTELR